MNKVERRKERVLLLLSEKDRLTVSEISSRFSISPATARRLCNELAEEGKAARSHGAIMKKRAAIDGYDFDQAMDKGYCEKKRIARYVSDLLRDGDNVFLETGSTVMECAFALAERIQSGKLHELHVFTNFLPHIDILGNFCEVSLLGGIYKPSGKKLSGYLAEQALKKMNFDYCLLGCDGISLDDGIMTYDTESAQFIEPLLDHSKHAVIVAHSEKFYQRSLISFMPCKSAHAIITDDGLSAGQASLFIKQGIDLVRV